MEALLHRAMLGKRPARVESAFVRMSAPLDPEPHRCTLGGAKFYRVT